MRHRNLVIGGPLSLLHTLYDVGVNAPCICRKLNCMKGCHPSCGDGELVSLSAGMTLSSFHNFASDPGWK